MQDTDIAQNQNELRYGVVSKPGGRDYNEDSCAVRDYSLRRMAKYLCLMAMADGMGGHNAGDVASQVAVQMFEQLAGPRQFEDSGAFSEIVERVIWNAFSAINSHIHDLGEDSPEHRGMGTTLTCALIDDSFAYIGHVGDSRAYIISSDSIERLTEDHSVVGKMVAEGILTEREAQSHSERNVLTRAIGPEVNVEIDIMKVAIKPGEIVFMCSDGLHSVVLTSEIFQVLRTEGNLQYACERLTDLAIARGSDDNISAIAWMMPLAETLAVTGGSKATAREAGSGLRWWAVALLAVLALGLGFFAGWGIGVAAHLGRSTSTTRSSQPSSTSPKAVDSATADNQFPYGTFLQISLENPTDIYYLRGDPTTQGAEVAKLPHGCKLEVISKSPRTDASGKKWWKVKVIDQGQLYEKTGFAREDCLKKAEQERMSP